MTKQYWELRKYRNGGSYHSVPIVEAIYENPEYNCFYVQDGTKGRNFFHQPRTREQARKIAKQYMDNGYQFA